MIFKFFHYPQRDVDRITPFYGAIVAQGRSPGFYQSYGVPDTVNGRFEMLVLHAILLLQRLNGASEPLRMLGQDIFDMFCSNMDANLRELGVGDLAVPKKMRMIGEAFYGRQSVYQAALGATDPGALVAALTRNVFGAKAPPAGAERLAAYVWQAARCLAAQDDAALSRGTIPFPDPESVGAEHVNAQGALDDPG